MKALLATDGSEYSYRAAKFLTNLNLSSDDEITVFHVITGAPFTDNPPADHSALLQIKQDIASEIIRTTIDRLKSLKTKTNSLLADGYPGQGIIDTAEKIDADMIVMGAKGLKGMKRIFIGSVARFVAINSSKPVLVVKGPGTKQPDPLKILFATDGSDYAKETGRLLVSMPFHRDVEMTILKVIQSGLDIPEKFNIKIDEKIKKTLTDLRSSALKESEKTIDQACRFIGEKFIKINCFTKDGDPALEILKMAKELKTDLIAVGSKGMRGIKGMMGSVSRYILGHSEGSVLIGKTGE